MPAAQNWPGDEFELIRVLGRGANGWVALARHLPLNRLVAVKTIEGVTGSAAARIQREGQLLVALRRPSIVTVYQLRTTPHVVCIVMAYLPGGDLESVLGTRQLDVLTALAVLTRVADALTAAHAAGVVHRDVKPGNVLLDAEGQAVLADFGLARLPGVPAVFRTSAAVVTGTPQFMAPEQIIAPDVATPAIDAYAFGMLGYRLLVGRYPFPAATVADLYHHHLSSEPAPPALLRAGFPEPAGRAILQALAKDPAARLTPEQLAAALSSVRTNAWSALAAWSPGPPRTVRAAGSATCLDTKADDTDVSSRPPASGRTAATPVGGAPAQPLIRRPEREEWITPVAPELPPGGHNRRRAALLLGVAVGIVAGVLLYLLLFRAPS